MRSIMRNILKHRLGTNRIAQAWKDLQAKRYGVEVYKNMYYAMRRKAQ